MIVFSSFFSNIQQSNFYYLASDSRILSIFSWNIFFVSSFVRAIPDAIVGFPFTGIYRNAGIPLIPKTDASSCST